MSQKRFIIGNIILFVVLVLVFPLTATQAQGGSPVTTNSRVTFANTCEDVLTRAMNTVQATCDGLGRNKACYGNNQIKIEPKDGASLKFDTAGDRVALQDIRTLITSSLDMQTGTWGLSLLKVQANLPDSLPGQNITFLVFGDTSIENTSGNMQAFYFTSGLGNLECKSAPRDGILIRSPQHTEVTFSANGVQITIASTILLHAERNRSMSVKLIEGHARLTTPAGSQTLQPGQESSVTLGGNNGLTAVDAPSVPAITTTDSDPNLAPVLTTATQVEDVAAPVSVSFDGCISAVNGNSITVNDTRIDVGSNQVLKAANVGDCVHIDGERKINNGVDTGFVLIKANNLTSPVQVGNTNDNGNGLGNGDDGNNGKDKGPKDKGPKDPKDTGPKTSGNSGNGNGGGKGGGKK